jgi:hypothetical protein
MQQMEISMSSMMGSRFAGEMTASNWLAIRKRAALKINPTTAEVDWRYGAVFDPYEIKLNGLPEELRVAGRVHFARSPGSPIWVSFDDLPDAVRDALWEKHGDKLALRIPLRLDS